MSSSNILEKSSTSINSTTKFNVSPDSSRTTTSIYDSALENLTAYTSFNESTNSDKNYTQNNISTDFDVTLNAGAFNLLNSTDKGDEKTTMDASFGFIQPESILLNYPADDLKSQLANNSIFEAANPNLSIIEISDHSNRKNKPENPIMESSSSVEDNSIRQKNQPIYEDMMKFFESADTRKHIPKSTSDNKSRSKPEAFLHKDNSSVTTEKLTFDQIGFDMESGAAVCESGPSGNASSDDKSEKKRQITIYDTVEEFEQNLPSTVTVLDTPFGSKVYLVGTAHFSEESQDDVSYVIRNVRPDVVMVELCPSRIHILKLDEKTLLEEAKSFNLAKIRSLIQANGYINGIFSMLLLQMSAQFAKDLGMAPGGEFRRAFEEIHKLPGCMLHLGDRPIRITLQRALRALSLWQTIKLVWKLTSKDTISLEEVEECKQRDLLEKLMQEMAGEFPGFSDVFIKERDLFLCHSLQLAALPQARADGSKSTRPVRVVGVVGIGHANGIARNWGRVDPQIIPVIMEIPPASISTRVCQYTIKYGLIGLTLFGAFKILRPRFSRFF